MLAVAYSALQSGVLSPPSFRQVVDGRIAKSLIRQCLTCVRKPNCLRVSLERPGFCDLDT